MSSISKRVAALATAGALVGGGVLAAVAFGASGTHKDSTTTPSTTSSTTTTKGTWRSNEDPAHEKGESAAREAQENAGRAGGDRKSTRLNSSHIQKSRMPSSA